MRKKGRPLYNNKSSNRIEIYKTLIETIRFEVRLSYDKFYSNVKIHLALFAGIFSIGSFAIIQDKQVVLMVPALISFLGIIFSLYWRKQITNSSLWERKWSRIAAEFEEREDFKKLTSTIQIWSHSSVKNATNINNNEHGLTEKMYKTLVCGIIAIYLLIILFCLLPFYYKIGIKIFVGLINYFIRICI